MEERARSNMSPANDMDLTAKESRFTTRTQTEQIVREELQIEARELRKDFISIFGLFAAFLTFTVLQIQALIQATKMSLIVGCATLFAAISLTFVLSLHNLVNNKNEWREFTRPVFILIVVMLFFSFECFWYATHNGKLWLIG